MSLSHTKQLLDLENIDLKKVFRSSGIPLSDEQVQQAYETLKKYEFTRYQLEQALLIVKHNITIRQYDFKKELSRVAFNRFKRIKKVLTES